MPSLGYPHRQADARHARTSAARTGLVYEPKYDGIRAIVDMAAASGAPIRIWSRLGNEKTAQFPEFVAALDVCAKLRAPVILDGEIVALDEHGEPAGFQQLQGRIHLAVGPAGSIRQVAFIAFDILRDGDADLVDLPLTERRARLEKRAGEATGPLVRLSEVVTGEGHAMFERAKQQGWEGLIAKRAIPLPRGQAVAGLAQAEDRQEQEFVIGGLDRAAQRPIRTSARCCSAYTRGGALEYAGHTGTGFNGKSLRSVEALLTPLETPESPFAVRPSPNERPHWVRPALVAQVKFTEWTADGKLRHPMYLGLRDDMQADEVRREPNSPAAQRSAAKVHGSSARVPGARQTAPGVSASTVSVPAEPRRTAQIRGYRRTPASRSASGARDRRATASRASWRRAAEVTNLHKVFWPKELTKGDLMRYYVRVSPFILPVVADRPLVMKRFPNGIDGKGVLSAARARPCRRRARGAGGRRRRRAQPAHRRDAEDAALHDAARGDLAGPVVFTRAVAGVADHVAIDLDPMPDAPFSRVLEVARWVRDELGCARRRRLPEDVRGGRPSHLHSASARHAVRGRPDFLSDRRDDGREKHPKAATVERAVRARGAARCTWTTCRTSRARRWHRPTAPAPATTPASRRRSRGTRSTGASIAATSRSARSRYACSRSATCGPRFASRRV